MEERIPRLEVKVDHLQSDVAEIKARQTRLEEKIDDVRVTLEGKIDDVRVMLEGKIEALRVQLEGKIDALRERLEGKIDALTKEIEALKRSRWIDRVWWLVIGGAILGVMARGFKWI